MAKLPSKKPGLCFVLLLGAAALSACDDNHTPPQTGAFRVANADAGDGSVLASLGSVASVGPVPFDSASSIVIVPAGSYTAQITPQASGSSAYEVGGVGISQNTLTTVFAVGSAYGPGTAASVSLLPPPSGQVTMQVLVDLPTAAQPALLYSFLFTPVGGSGQAAGANDGQTINLAPGKYEIQVVAGPDCSQGIACPAIGEGVFDSGPQGVDIPGSNGANVFQLAAVPASAAQQSQYSGRAVLLLLDNKGGSTALFDGQQ